MKPATGFLLYHFLAQNATVDRIDLLVALPVGEEGQSHHAAAAVVVAIDHITGEPQDGPAGDGNVAAADVHRQAAAVAEHDVTAALQLVAGQDLQLHAPTAVRGSRGNRHPAGVAVGAVNVALVDPAAREIGEAGAPFGRAHQRHAAGVDGEIVTYGNAEAGLDAFH